MITLMQSPRASLTLKQNWSHFCFFLIRRFRAKFSSTNIQMNIWTSDLHRWNTIKLVHNCSGTVRKLVVNEISRKINFWNSREVPRKHLVYFCRSNLLKHSYSNYDFSAVIVLPSYLKANASNSITITPALVRTSYFLQKILEFSGCVEKFGYQTAAAGHEQSQHWTANKINLSQIGWVSQL